MKKTILVLLTLSLLTTAFTGCANLSESNVATTTNSPDTENPASDFEYKDNSDGGITITKYIGTNTDVIIPEKIDGKAVTVIDTYSFQYNADVLSVKLPDTVTVIEGGAFWRCTSLTTVQLSQNLKSLKNSVFEDCSQLANIALPNSLTFIGYRTFANCTSLKHIRIPKSVTEWWQDSFANTGLETIELEEGLTVIGGTAFIGTQIKEVVVPGSIKTIPSGAFADCASLESITLNEGLEAVENFAFGSPSKLTEIIVPSTVTSFSELAFVECYNIQKLKFKGNAPADFDNQDPTLEMAYGHLLPSYTLCYHEGAEGFTSPEWCGYPTEIWFEILY